MKRMGFLRSAVVAAVLGGWAVVAASPAFALSAVPDAGVASVNGKVLTMSQFGNTLYIGGRFGKQIPTTGKKIDAINIGAVNRTTGQPIVSFSATVTDATEKPFVQALGVSPDGSTLYIAGLFDAVDGQPRENIAAVDAATGAIVPGFAPDAATAVNALLVGPDGKIYIGGPFKNVNHEARSHLAALNPDGTLDPTWLPNANDNIRTMVFAEDGNTIFIGGRFSTMNGATRVAVARVTPDTGALDPWTIPVGTVKAPQQAWGIAPFGTRLFVGFGNHGNFLAGFRLDNGNSGDQLWRLNTSGNVEAVTVDPGSGRVVFGGHFGTAGAMTVCGGQPLTGVGMVNPATGAVDCTWLPHMLPDTQNFKGGRALLLTGGQLWVGGYFTSISGAAVRGIARFTL
jgi:hypothetical protein